MKNFSEITHEMIHRYNGYFIPLSVGVIILSFFVSIFILAFFSGYTVVSVVNAIGRGVMETAEPKTVVGVGVDMVQLLITTALFTALFMCMAFTGLLVVTTRKMKK